MINEEDKINIIKFLLIITLFVIFIMAVGINETHAETLSDIDVILIQSGSYTEYARCDNTDRCTVYNKDDVRYTQVIFKYNFKAGNKYKFTTRLGYMYGKSSGLTIGQNYISSKRVYIYNSTYGSQDISCSVDEIEDYEVTNDASWETALVGGAVTFERNMNCEFTPNYDSTSLTAYITMTNSGINSASAYLVTRAEIVGGETAIDIIDNANQNQQQTNERLDNINDSLTSTDEPGNLNQLTDIAGYFPAGPLDSLINLPLSLLNSLSTALGSTCNPVILNLPFVDKPITLPCISTIYGQIDGLNLFFNSVGLIAGTFLLYNYFLYLRDWLESIYTLDFINGNGSFIFGMLGATRRSDF